MGPQAQFCSNPQCPARGQTAQDNIKVHPYRERRYRCTTCRLGEVVKTHGGRRSVEVVRR
jgi:hypothetical protein